MPTDQLHLRLSEVQKENSVTTKGSFGVVLVLTRNTTDRSPPYNADEFLTKRGGQVRGLGRVAVQAILADHGIKRVLAEEGGRTSRGSIDHMRAYIKLLNELHAEGLLDHAEIEAWWIERVQAYFVSQPLKVKLDSARSLRSIIAEILEAAFTRQRECPGTMVAGAVLQHLVGAKLEFALPQIKITHEGFSVADAPGKRKGDFLIGDTAIHVTTAPSDALIRKCVDNLAENLRPLIVTTVEGVGGAVALARNANIGERIDILEVEQFLATNIYERTVFQQAERAITIRDLVTTYNRIVEECETDPSLKIEIG